MPHSVYATYTRRSFYPSHYVGLSLCSSYKPISVCLSADKSSHTAFILKHIIIEKSQNMPKPMQFTRGRRQCSEILGLYNERFCLLIIFHSRLFLSKPGVLSSLLDLN